MGNAATVVRVSRLILIFFRFICSQGAIQDLGQAMQINPQEPLVHFWEILSSPR